jgi:hypothetical protein
MLVIADEEEEDTEDTRYCYCDQLPGVDNGQSRGEGFGIWCERSRNQEKRAGLKRQLLEWKWQDEQGARR